MVRRVPVFLADGGRLAVRVREGDGPTLVLLHGLTDFGESFDLVAPCLEGARLIVPDLRGHGGSVRTGVLTVAAFAGDMLQALDQLDIGEAVIVGHSMGSMVATALAAIAGRGRVRGLVLLGGSLRPDTPALCDLRRRIVGLPFPLAPDAPFFAEWHQCMTPVARPFLDRLAENAATIAQADWLQMIDAIAATDQRALARRLDMPVLALSGRDDPLFPPDHLAEMARSFPDCRTRLLVDCGHNPHWEQPGTVAATILAFARQAPACALAG